MNSHAMTRTVLTGLAATALTVTTIAGTAVSASAADTAVTFELAGGLLSVSAPATAVLSTGGLTLQAGEGGTAKGVLTSVKVTDGRASLLGSWSATVTSSDFVNQTVAAAPPIPASNVRYWSGAATMVEGLGVPVPGQLTELNAVVIAAAKPAFSKDVGAGSNATTWSPTVAVDIPAGAVAGRYSGTITHSVS